MSSTPVQPTPRLILASSSEYRRSLLSRLCIAFEVVVPDVDERPLPDETPQVSAQRLAREKAAAVACTQREALIIGSDQVATLDGEQIGKPGSHVNALAQLKKMQGRTVLFHTALCLWDTRAGATQMVQVDTVSAAVTFRDLPEASLDAYLRIEKPYDCAGSAKNEGLGIALIARIDSNDPTALTGLPLISLCSMLQRAGIAFFSPRPS